MNLLIPDSWLCEYLQTNAAPEQIKEYLSLCGPSIERMNKVGNEMVYDVEVTSNRPDSMSILGIAREAAAILPRFGIEATLINNPYQKDYSTEIKKYGVSSTTLPAGRQGSDNKVITIEADPKLCPRWTSIIFNNITIKQSPSWLKKKLELTGIRSLNNLIDITNYLMRSFGQPAHAFDFDEIKSKNGVPFMKLRSARRRERITTLDGKTHALAEGDIVIEDGSGRLIDLCGIMGAENSRIKDSTKNVLLFMQTYNPVNIRRTMMRLSHHTEAGSLFEKGPDSELVLPTVLEGIKLVEELAGGKVASKLYDIYPEPYKPCEVSLSRTKTDSYIGKRLDDQEIHDILSQIGLTCQIGSNTITVTVPSFRHDIEIDVDIIEEIARIYGYHNIKTRLPEGEPPVTIVDPMLTWEEEVKVRLRDWGFTETYTYSMISEEFMNIFELDKTKAYKIANPLSSEWVYMRQLLLPSLLKSVKENLNHIPEFKLFELSMIYQYQENDLPKERPTLGVVWTGECFAHAKGLVETLFDLFGISFPETPTKSINYRPYFWKESRTYPLGDYGVIGEIHPQLLNVLEIRIPITVVVLNFDKLVADARPNKKYEPIPKYPPIIEDMSFILPERTYVGNVVESIKAVSPLIYSVELLDQYENTSTFRINYLDRNKPLANEEVEIVREQIIQKITKEFSATIKGAKSVD